MGPKVGERRSGRCFRQVQHISAGLRRPFWLSRGGGLTLRGTCIMAVYARSPGRRAAVLILFRVHVSPGFNHLEFICGILMKESRKVHLLSPFHPVLIISVHNVGVEACRKKTRTLDPL